MIRGEGTVTIPGVTPQEVFDFVVDPASYRKADTKITSVRKIADTDDGMIADEKGKFLGVIPGSAVLRYRWEPPHRVSLSLERGFPERVDARFEIDAVEGGTRVRHIEEIEIGHGPLGWIHDRLFAGWWAASVRKEVDEIARLMTAGERGRGLGAHGT